MSRIRVQQGSTRPRDHGNQMRGFSHRTACRTSALPSTFICPRPALRKEGHDSVEKPCTKKEGSGTQLHILSRFILPNLGSHDVSLSLTIFCKTATITLLGMTRSSFTQYVCMPCHFCFLQQGKNYCVL